MSHDLKVSVGGSAAEDAQAFLSAWHRSEAGEAVAERLLAFEGWEALESLLTPQRYRMLKALHHAPAGSIQELADRLGRPYRRVHDDVVALSAAGLIQRSEKRVRLLWDGLNATVRFG